MLDPFDYKEPSCAVCGGSEFYNPDIDAPVGKIPVKRIIEKVDACFNKNDVQEAKRLLEYWQNEAVTLKDVHGELSVLNELVGLYRKTQEKEKAIKSIERAMELVVKLGYDNGVSGATIMLNCATTYKAFAMAEIGLPIYKKAEKIYNEKLDKGDRKFGGLFNNMALAFADLLEHDKAVEYYYKAIAVMEKVEDGKPDTAISYVNLAHLYQTISQDEKAKECIEKAISLLNDQSVTHDGYFAFVCEKCAPSIDFFGFTSQAEKLATLSKEIYARS